MSVPKIVNNIGSSIYSGFTNFKPMKELINGKVTRKTVKNITAGATIGSIVLKDGIGCIMYVEQSKHNKKIPEERRNFVWKLDAVNGGLMIAFQLLFFLGVRKFNDKLFTKLFKSFRPENANSFIEQARVDKVAKTGTTETKAELAEQLADFKSTMTDVFRSVTELVASTILAKRVVVPFIATYLTDKLESKHEKKLGANAPSMTGATETEKQDENSATAGANLDISSSAAGTTNLLELYSMKK